MRRKIGSRWLATLLAVAMCLSLLPLAAFAAEEVTWTQVAFDEIQDTDVIAIVMTAGDTSYVMQNDGGMNTYGKCTTWDSSVVTDDTWKWNIVSTTGGYTIYPAGDTSSWLYTINNNNGLRVGTSTTGNVWNVDVGTETNSGYLYANDGTQNRYVGVYKTGPNFRDYTSPNGNNIKGQTPAFYKLSGDTPAPTKVSKPSATPAGGSSVAAGATVTLKCATADVTFCRSENGEAPWTNLDDNTFTLPSEAWEGNYTVYIKAMKADLDDSDVLTLNYKYKAPAQEVTIAQARAAENGAEFIVTGTVILIDGKNVVVQDETGGINLYCSSAPSSLALGDTVKGTGTLADYKGLAQLSSATIEKTASGALPAPKAITIAQVGETYESQLITITDAKVTAINGTTVTLSQGEGDAAVATTIYKCPTKENLTVGDTITVTAVVSQFTDYQLRVSNADNIVITDDVTPDPDVPDPAQAVLPTAGDYVVWVGSTYNQSLSSNTNSSGYVLGQAVTVNPSGTLSGPTATEVWTLTRTDTTGNTASGTYTLNQGDKYLGISANGYLTVDTAPTNKDWTIEVSGQHLYMKSNGNNKYLEWYAQYSDWSLFGTDQPTSDLYQLTFTPVSQVLLPEVSVYETDADIEETIASWGGSGPYDETANATQIPGDRYTTGDLKDASAAFTIVANGAAAQPYQRTEPSTGGYNYYMGGKDIGKTAGDYAQFSLVTAGWADMTLSFRMRVTGTAAGSWQLQYSADNGATFRNFTTGAYSYAYTQYNSEGSTTITGDGKITDGVALPSKAATQYVAFTFDVPAGAENAQALLIRLVPGTTRADGKEGTPAGNIRLDSVVLSGSPIVSDAITGYVAVTPDGVEEDQAPGTELTMTSATENATISYRFGGQGGYQTYDPAAKPVLPDPLPTTLEVYATAPGKTQSVTRVFNYAAGTVDAVRMTPNGGGVIFNDGEDAKEITLTCATPDSTIWYALSTDGLVFPEEYTRYEAPIPVQKGFQTLTVRAYATRAGFTDSPVVTRVFTERATDRYQLFFGQLHSHTSYSDGAGTAQEAFKHAKGLDHKKWNVDFLAVTDHSNSFDNADTCSITDGSASAEWVEGHQLAKAATDDSFVGIFGYEMTWSNGLGHINTFNTDGFQSRTQADYTNYSTALQNYYAALKTVGSSISQFNHPGTTFGDFSDFAHYDEEIDQLITMIEVGNGEGAIGSSGYFPSYEHYTRALDKGWHVAPSNNQDNHKGGWGDSNTARDVVLVDELTEDAIYDAMRNYRMYATEDLNLSIYYTFDGQIMGSILDKASYPNGSKATIKVELSDADTVSGVGDAGNATVEVIGNGGIVVEKTTASCKNSVVELEVPTDYSYYYIKVTQADGDIAVTAPVWVGKVEAVGVGSLTAASQLTVENQEQAFTLELFNNEKKPLTVNSIVFTDDDGNVLHTATDITSVPKLSTASTTFSHTFAHDGKVTITATVKGSLNGVDKTYTQKLELTVMPKSIVKRVIVDGTHFNDYVTGYYGGNMNNAATIAAALGVEVVVEKTAITADMLEDCELLVISAPARKKGTANAGEYVPTVYESDFIDMVKAYVAGGGRVAVCGLADYQDGGKDTEYQTSVQQNKLLEAIGSTLRINDDEVIDDVHNGGQPFRLYPENFNLNSKWCKGIVTGQTYSQYSGCSVDPGKGEALVMGFDTTWGGDSDKDGTGVLDGKSYSYSFNDKTYTLNAVVDKGDVVFLAAEDVGAGTVFAAGGVFLSDFEVKAELDNIWDLPYANRTIFENILSAVREDVPVTPIADTRTAELNKIFVVEGYVTNGTTDPNTTFFDAIYVQDETGGTTAFPYATSGLAIGAKVRILGYTDAYQGDREIQILTLEVLDDASNKYAPKVLTTEQAADYNTYGGQLVTTSGSVSDIIKDNGVVSQFKLTDDSGVAATVFIDGYITNAKGRNTIASWIKDGQKVSAVGLLYLHPEGSSDVSVPVLRVRNCDEIVWLDRPSSSVHAPFTPSEPTTAPLPFEDVSADDWFSGPVTALYNKGLIAGTDDTHFTPHIPLTRGAAATLLYRLEGRPIVSYLTPFSDVETGNWYTDGVRWAQQQGVVNGYEDGRFGPDDSVTREQMVAILYRYAQLKGYSGTAPTDLSAFADADAVSPYAAEAVSWAVANGLMQGVGGDRLAPTAPATRAEIAALLSRFLTRFAPETAEK